MTKERLRAEFSGFDSVDPRMERVPLDLRSLEKRQEYLANHKKWFLKRHENAAKKLEESVKSLYGNDSILSESQFKLLEEGAPYKTGGESDSNQV